VTLKVIGAGLGRTGTLSLKGALETLLGGTAYHMAEVFFHPAHVPVWSAAAAGEAVDWENLFEPYVATTDFPACLFWRELSNIYPDAVVLLSTRSDVDTWWASAHETIFSITAEAVGPERADWWTMWQALKAARFTSDLYNKAAVCDAYERHNAAVRSGIAPGRLVDWQPGDGWEPICTALGLSVPTVPFPHMNRRAETQESMAQVDLLSSIPTEPEW